MTMEKTTPEVRMTVDGHVCVISLDNVAKKNAITPELMAQLSTHLTTFEDDDDLWVAILDPAGEHTTAGLDMPKFFGPTATAKPLPEDQVDPFALQRRTTKPVISVVHGITYTIGIEMMLAGDVVIAADTARFCQLESKRGIAPFGGAHFRYLTRTGWGNAMYHLFLCDEFDAQEALRIGFVQEVHPYGMHREARDGDRAADLSVRAARPARDEEGGARVPRARRAGGGRGHPGHPEGRLRHRGLQGRHPVVHRAARGALPGAMSVPCS